MSISFNCHCAERKKPIADRNWTVVQHRCNHSAFNGYQYTPSDYSTVRCCACGRVGRTKAAYVYDLVTAGKTGWDGKEAPK